MIPIRTGAALGVSVLALCACGGGGDAPNTGSSGGTGTAYPFVTPVQGATRTYRETIVDNANNTITIGFMTAVTAVNGDGTFTQTQMSTTGFPQFVNGTNYAVPTQDETFTAAGQELTDTYTDANGVLQDCVYAPHGTGPDSPVQVGEAWTVVYTSTCNSGSSLTITQKGTVVDVESLTVPAGTFNALRLESTETYTDGQGTTRTLSITNWRDVVTSSSVQQQITIAYSGTSPAAGYPVSRMISLESTT